MGPTQDEPTTTYSLISVHRTNSDGTVDGSWIQDHIGTLESSRARAERTSSVNSGMDVAVIRSVGFCGPCDVVNFKIRLA